ncbi:hypothetical protein RCL_jg13901.t1 [Rhizophagus clarus]|uniref:Uncharacterized protein n=1 Tax=Rhizophagus clarus TaxID=94130 RepID=A0A8H3QTS8_9GLOM|nr:hypothetical protein RCL_jg13901.t1 [Rhizophagus clarus]
MVSKSNCLAVCNGCISKKDFNGRKTIISQVLEIQNEDNMDNMDDSEIQQITIAFYLDSIFLVINCDKTR